MFSSSHPSSHSRKKRVRTVSQTPGRLAPAPAFLRAISAAQKILDESHMRDVFDRHADSNSKRELSSRALIAALKEAEAPLVLSSASSFSEDDIFRRADANLSGAVDFEEYDSSNAVLRHLCLRLIPFLKVLARGSVAGRVTNAFGG